MNNDHPRHSVPWLAVLLVLAALFSFIQIANEGRNDLIMYGVSNSSAIVPPDVARSSVQASPSLAPTDMTNSAGVASAPQMMESSDAMIARAPYPYPNGGTPAVTDTRELNKIYYNASMKTRDVPKLTKLVETTVRGNGGRVDQVTSSDMSGMVRFVVPQTKFDAFRDQIEGLVNSHFLSVSIDSQNMLPQKQAIETQQDYTKMNLDQLNTAKKSENTDYAKKKASIQAQIDANNEEAATLAAALQTADEVTKPNITSRQVQVAADINSLRNKLSVLAQNHMNIINSIDAQIGYANSNMDNLHKQDQNLMDDVATVSGTISINWISLWEIVRIYLPGYSIPGIFLTLAFVAGWWHRRKAITA